ncbi:MAG: transporter [Deltaproteobacteria bacterium]|nr:transporter [Deltaproteobacteria bacterium]
MKNVFVMLLTAFLVFGTSRLAVAEEEKERGYQQPLQEVFQTEVVYPQEKGEVQLTIAPRFSEGDAQNIIQIPLSIEYGITDAWQIELEWDAFVNRDPTAGGATRGIGDLEIGTKYSFMNIADWAFHVAAGFEISLPLGDLNKELTEGFIEYEPFFILAKDFPKLNNSQIFTQFGISLVQRIKNHTDPDEDEPAAHELNWNIGFFVPAGPIRFTTEFNWRNNRWNNDGEENQMYLTPGLVWDLPKTWELGLGIPIGLNGTSDNFRVIAMLTYEFRLLNSQSAREEK